MIRNYWKPGFKCTVKMIQKKKCLTGKVLLRIIN